MANLMDYLEWRGDLSLEEAPLNEVDNLIFCLLSYVDLDGIVPMPYPTGRAFVTLRQAAMEYFFTHDDTMPRPLGLIVPADILTLFRRMASTKRFASLRLCGYVNEICEEREMQFSALTVLLPGEAMFVAFRGTDDTLVGWREDFNLSYMDEVPSQRKATDYLNCLDMPPETALYVGGHSKGGNLAVWGAVHADEAVRRRIRLVWSNDGPGFTEGTVASEAYRSLAERIRILLPDASLIGLLLEHGDGYAVVKSNRRGLFQHDGLSWEVMGAQFVRSDGLSKRGVRADTVVRERIDSMSREEKRLFTRLFFNILESTGAKTLTDLHEGRIKAAVAMLRTVSDMTREDQETATYLLGKLFGVKATSATVVAGESGEETPARPMTSRKKVRMEWWPAWKHHA